MRSKWIEHNGIKLFYQDFSNLGASVNAVLEELKEVEVIVIAEPYNSVRVLADFRNTEVNFAMMDALQTGSKMTKNHVHKTAVLGVTGTKRVLANILMRATGQKLEAFEDEEAAKNWLAKE
jgi:hypothetical protein